MFFCRVFDVNVCLMLVAGFFIMRFCLYIYIYHMCVRGVMLFFAGLFAAFSMFLADFLMFAYSFWFCFL